MTTLTKAQRKELMEKLLAKTDLPPQIKAEMQRLGVLARERLLDKYRAEWGEEAFNTIHTLPEGVKAKVMQATQRVRVCLSQRRNRPIAQAMLDLNTTEVEALRLSRWGNDLLDFQFPSTLFQPCWGQLSLDNDDFTDDELAPLTALLTEYATVRDTLAHALAGIRTHKQLAEQMPEAAALMPSIDNTHTLVDPSAANNATALLMKHGVFKKKNDADK